MELMLFLLQAVAVSLSGVLAPGPMTATALAAGLRRPHAGVMLALGHIVVELPLMLLIVVGLGYIFEITAVKVGIGLVGAVVLGLMGVQMLRDARKEDVGQGEAVRRHPFFAGIILTGANPYFLIWWATVGMKLTLEVKSFGALAFCLFALIHWLCDLVWVEVLSYSSYKGREVVSGYAQRVILYVCGGMLLFFMVKFGYDAVVELMRFGKPVG